jgi:hypothetical protein
MNLVERKLGREAAADAVRSVARESDAAVLSPHYTESALHQMGWARSYGASRLYRGYFTSAFVAAWQARVAALSH